MNIVNLLAAAARTFPERPALSVGTKTVATYQQFAQRVARLAGALRERCGNTPAARVAIVASNSPEYIEAMWAAWQAGLCVVPVNAKLHPKEVAFILENCGTSLCFVGEDLAAHNYPNALVLGSREYTKLLEHAPIAAQAVAPSDPAWLFYTSGTTGRPKGATLTHRNLLEMSLRNYADIDAVGAEDCILHVAPLSHATGLFSLFHIGKASNQVIPESRGFREDELVELIGHYSKCLLFLAPTMLNRLVSHPASAGLRKQNLKTLIYGGAPMYLEDLKRALERCGPCLWQGYGQGETPNTIAFLSKEWHTRKDHPRYEAILSSVGVPRTGIAVRVVDDEDRELPPGEIGEVIVKSEVTMSGYWGNPEATAKALKGGWLHTGDLGTFDEQGFLTLKDRSKDVIISGGSNIYPREVEEVLLVHPGVLEASVIGRPSKQWGEEVIAFVVRKQGAAVKEAELDQLCLENIARFKRPKAYFFIEALPKSNYGKILKTELRERARELEPQKEETWKH
jgi:long-chain acyl-CoA synthetase